jgi:hypothetical protein
MRQAVGVILVVLLLPSLTVWTGASQVAARSSGTAVGHLGPYVADPVKLGFVSSNKSAETQRTSAGAVETNLTSGIFSYGLQSRLDCCGYASEFQGASVAICNCLLTIVCRDDIVSLS